MTARMLSPTSGAPNGTTSTRAAATDWRSRAACLGEDPELFFPGTVGRPPDDQIAEAKAICRTCPVTADCLANAPDEGIWGGLTETERRDITTLNACGTGAGRSRHRRAGTPVCGTCLTYETQIREANNLRNWQKLAPHLDRGQSLEAAAAAIGLGLDAARRARNTAARQQRDTAA